MKQTEGVPRGLLRFIVLKFLADKPMSGTEIVQKIAHETKEKWKPSPGSIYPLLSHLQKKGYTVEYSKNENAIKQYTLTNDGKIFFREQVLLGQEFMEKMRCLMPIFIDGFQLDVSEPNFQSVKESAKRLLQTFVELDTNMHKLAKENISQITQILDESNFQLTEVIQKIDQTNTIKKE